MRVAMAVLCDAASVREGLLHSLGAGITNIGASSYPAPLLCDLALMFETTLQAEPRASAIEIQLRHSVAPYNEVVSVGLEMEQAPAMEEEVGLPTTAALALPLRNFGLPEPGPYEFLIKQDGAEVAVVKFIGSLITE